MNIISPNYLISMILFLILTFMYFIIKYILKLYFQENSNSFITILFFAYIGSIISSQLFVNAGLTKDVCGTTQWYTAFFMTVIPWLLVFGLLKVLLDIFPGWLSPFSNTFGYGIAVLFGLKEKFLGLLKVNGTNDDKKRIMYEIYNNPSVLINQINGIRKEDIIEFYNSFSSYYFKSDLNADTVLDTLEKYIYLKTYIAEFIWFVLVGTLTISISHNNIINTACKNSVKEMKLRHQEYEKDVTIKEKALKGSPQKRIYATYD